MEESNGQTSQIVHSDYEEFRKWKSRRELLRQVKKLSWAFAAAFFLQNILLSVTQNIAAAFWTAIDSQHIFNSNLLWELAAESYSFIYYFLVFLLPYLLFAKLAGFKLLEIPHNRPYSPIVLASTGFAMGISLVGIFLSNAALNFFYVFFDKNPPEFPAPPSGSFALVLYVINSVVLPPIIEEIAYRGILLGSLRRYGDKTAIVISSLLFGLAHGNMSQFPYSFVLGMTIAFFVIKTNSIYTGIFIHFVNNGIAIFLEFLTMHMNPLMGDMVYALKMLVDLLVFLVALFYLIWVRKVDWKLPSGSLPGVTVVRQFFVTIPMFFVLCALVWNILTSFT